MGRGLNRQLRNSKQTSRPIKKSWLPSVARWIAFCLLANGSRENSSVTGYQRWFNLAMRLGTRPSYFHHDVARPLTNKPPYRTSGMKSWHASQSLPACGLLTGPAELVHLLQTFFMFHCFTVKLFKSIPHGSICGGKSTTPFFSLSFSGA